jgi:hypothetical protein
MPRLPNVAQKYFELDHVHGNGAETFDCILCYDILSANLKLTCLQGLNWYTCLEIFGLSLFMDYECDCCCQFQTEFCTNTTGCDGDNLEIILEFVCYKYDDIRISPPLPYNIRSV